MKLPTAPTPTFGKRVSIPTYLWLPGAMAVGLGLIGLAGVVSVLKQANWAARCPSIPGSAMSEIDGICRTPPRTCPQDFLPVKDSCVVMQRQVRIPPGKMLLGPSDWEAEGRIKPSVIAIDESFMIDVFEVTTYQWKLCAEGGTCPRLNIDADPGLPMRNVTKEEAKTFCRWAGGDLPGEGAWIWAAAGPQGRRYAWGDTGAVCRVACWGLFDGPCAHGLKGPDWAGIYPADSTPEGVRDLAGSVAEWVTGLDGTPRIHGGSFRVALAAELRTWHVQERDPDRRWDDVGFRCVYHDSAKPEASTQAP